MLSDEDLKAQLKRVLGAVEQLLPKVVDPIDWSQIWAANWRRYSFAGYLEGINDLDPVTLDDLLGIDPPVCTGVSRQQCPALGNSWDGKVNPGSCAVKCLWGQGFADYPGG